MPSVFDNPSTYGAGTFIFDDPTLSSTGGLMIDSTDASMQRRGTFSLTYTSPNIVSTSLNTTLTSGNDTLSNPVVTANGGDSYTADFAVGDLTKQVDATGYDWTLEITP